MSLSDLLKPSNKIKPIPVDTLLKSDPIYCCLLDGKGFAIKVNDDNKSKLKATVENPCWIHLDYMQQSTREWLDSTDLLPDLAKKALLDNDLTSNEARFDTGILVTIKGVNPAKETNTDVLVAFRFYISDNLIISSHRKQNDMILEITKNLDRGIGPVDVADWLIQFSDLLSEEGNKSFDNIHESIIKLEDKILNEHLYSHSEIGHIRRELNLLRRVLVPQRDIFVKIATERVSWIDDNDRQHLHDISTRLTHSLSDIDTSILRLNSIMEQINSLLTESMNKRIYFMTLWTLIFLPITFLSSLFGVNLVGIPFSGESWAFGMFAGILLVISFMVIIWLKSKKWF